MSLIISMILFSFSMSITPGPVNLITLTSGVNYGFKKTMPFVSGATIGFIILLLSIGLGLSIITTSTPNFISLLRYLGSAFIAYMGYKIMFATRKLESSHNQRPTFIQGVLLQWLNPKAWMACIAGVSAFNVSQSNTQLLMFVFIYLIVCYLCIALWALAGEKIKLWLNNENNMKIFNFITGASLLLIAILLVIG